MCCVSFFFNDTATTEIYTLSLHDALPIYYLYNNLPVSIPHGLILIQREAERYKSELLSAQQTIEDKNRQIDDLKEEVDKLQCVLQQKVNGGKQDILATIQVSASLSLSSLGGKTVHTYLRFSHTIVIVEES